MEQMTPPYVLEIDGKLAEMGFEPRDNSAEEIVEVVQEMMDIISGTISYSEEDQRLQSRVRIAFDSPFSNKSACRIGRDFLKRYAELLPA